MDSLREPYLRDVLRTFRNFKALAEKALAQVSDDQLHTALDAAESNTLAIIVKHVGGNLRSRFTDFLTTDGEKPWRKREEEFQARRVTKQELLAHWEAGWSPLLATLSTLTDADLTRSVTIRGQPLRVDEALHRSLAHSSYHVGQIVYAARALRGSAWRFLSIPPGRSDAFNANPQGQSAAEHAAWIRRGGA